MTFIAIKWKIALMAITFTDAVLRSVYLPRHLLFIHKSEWSVGYYACLRRWRPCVRASLAADYFCHKIIILKDVFFQLGFNLKMAPWRPLGGIPWEDFCVSFWMWYKGIQKPHWSTEKLLVTLMNLKLWDFIPPNNTPRYPHETPGPFGILKGPKLMP